MDMINARELALQLRVSISTIRRWTRLRKIPHIRVDKKFVRYEIAAVLSSLNITTNKTFNGGRV